MPPLNTLSRSCLALAISQAMLVPANAATIEVNDNGDTDGADAICTLREAIVSANTNPVTTTSGCVSGEAGTDTITVVGGGPIFLYQANDLDITEDLVINGPNDETLVINGYENAGVFFMNSATVSLNNLTITGGSAGAGGGFFAYSSIVSLSNSTVSGNIGGGFFSYSSTVNLSNSIVSANSGGGVNVTSSSSVSFTDSTVSNNSAGGNGGGIIVSFLSSVSLINSTVTGNSAVRGGGIHSSSSSVSLINSTVSGNSAGSNAGGIYARSISSVSLINSIIAGNSAATAIEINDLDGTTAFTTSYNLFGDSSHTNAQAFASFTPSGTDITATSNGTQPTVLSSILAPLADNGGATQSHALVVGSPALNVANYANCLAAPVNGLDQRSQSRASGSECDIGSFEFQPSVTVSVDNASDTSGSAICTLRDAITSINTSSVTGNCEAGSIDLLDSIVFDPAVFPLAAANTITLSSSLPTITSDMSITGQGASGLTIDANNTGRVFNINSAVVSLNSLMITGGGGSADFGGGLYIHSNSSVSLSNSTVLGNRATVYGGGIHVDSSSISLSNSTVSGNSAFTNGGGIFANGSGVNLSNITVSGNSASYDGGGVFANQSNSFSIVNSLIAGNLSTRGAEIFDYLGSTFTTNYNVLGDSSHTDTQAFVSFTPDGTDITATSNGSNSTALLSILSPLADNGGTKTHVLPNGSPAIDAANNTICVAVPINSLDQRGESRSDGECDIGAFEAQPMISIVATDANKAEGNSGTTNFSFTVSRTGNAAGVASVNYVVTGSGASQAVTADFIGGTLPSGLLSFVDSESSKVVSIPVEGDGLNEPDETFTVSLSNATNTTIATASAEGTIVNDDVAALTVLIAAASVGEQDGAAATTATVSRNTDTSSLLLVSLSSSDTSEATSPASVTIAAGQSTSPTFNLNAVDDAIVDGTQTVTITASAIAHADGSDTLDVTDNDVAALTVLIAAATVGEEDGAPATSATVSRNTDTSSLLTVLLASNDASEVTVPVSVDIAAGQSTSPTFNLNAVDDAIADGTQTVTITASATAHTNGSDTLDVTDNDVPEISIAIVADSISEGDGPIATFATVSRNTDTSSELTVMLASNDTSEAAIAAASVNITAGQSASPAFNIDAIEDIFVDGTQTVTLTASAAGHANGTDTLDVTDNDVPELTIVIAADSIGEEDGAGATTATVSRNTDTALALAVTLASNDTSEATVPIMVMIAAGQSSSSAFNIDAIQDTLIDGTQTVTITASAAAHADGTDTLDVTDDGEDSFYVVPLPNGKAVIFGL